MSPGSEEERPDRTESRTAEATSTDVLALFGVYQPKTLRMVAEEAGLDLETTAILLAELEERGDLTKARGGTRSPVWLRPYVPAIDRL